MTDLGLHEAFAVLTAGELEGITERASELAESLRAGESDSFSKSWAIVFSYIAGAARHALALRQLEAASV